MNLFQLINSTKFKDTKSTYKISSVELFPQQMISNTNKERNSTYNSYEKQYQGISLTNKVKSL
jgi:hypothetical protein